MAIKSNNGRWWSERTPQEVQKILKGDLDRLSPEEREALQILLRELEEQPAPTGKRLMDRLVQGEMKKEPVDIETFIKDPYYLGNTCDILYPKLVKDAVELFGGGYQEAVFTGSIGWGKTFLASIGICRILYELSLMKDPQRSFGLSPGSNIAIVVLSINETLATKVAFENIVTKLEASPYFQEHFPFEKTKKELRFPSHVWVAPRATTDGSALGLNVMSGLMDETDFIRTNKHDKMKGGSDKAEQLYNILKRRMKSRFERQGKLPGILFVVSSKTTHDSFSSRLLARSREDPNVFVRDYAAWEVKPEEYYSGDWFHVVVGNESVPSRILTPEEADHYQKELPDGCVLIKVPEDLRQDFESDLDGSVRDMAGVATVSVSPFIQRREKLAESIDLYKRTYGPLGGHPFTAEEYEPGKPGEVMWSKIVENVSERAAFLDPYEMKLRPRINPRAVRHIHIDPSLSNDATGFCMAHVSGFKNVERRTPEGILYTELAPIFTVDFLLRVIPPVGDEIMLSDMRQFVYNFTSHGYTITRVTLDQFQSADSIQQLEKKGYSAERLSVDITMDPYENLKSALYEGRLLMYEYEPLLGELRTIQRDLRKRKIDHIPNGSKDVADALAGCLFSLSQNAVHQPMPIVRTSVNSEDTWMPEQRGHVGNSNVLDGQTLTDMLPPFLIGGGGDD